MTHRTRKVNVICVCARTEITGVVRNTRVSQKSLSSLTTSVIKPQSIIWLLRQEAEGGFCLYLYLHLNLSFRGHGEVLHQKAAASQAELKIAPARTNAQPLNTLLQHCYWTNTGSWSTYKQHTHTHTWMSPCRLTRTCPVQENKYTSRRSTSTSHCFRSDVRQRHSISRLLTADRAQIHGPLSALRLGWKKEKSRGGERLSRRSGWRKIGKKSRERGRRRLENDRHSSNSRSTWAVSGWLAASPGRWRPAHVTLFMNGAVWRREDAAQGAAGGGGAFSTDSEGRSKERWRGEEKRTRRRRRGDVFQSSTSCKQQVRLRWRLCK